jgi:hypothetical protein
MLNLIPADNLPQELLPFPWNEFPDTVVAANDLGTPTSKTICVMNNVAPELALTMVQRKGQGHIVQKNALGFATEVGFAAGLLADPNAFFIKPLHTIFYPVNTTVEDHGGVVLKNSDEKNKILQQFEAFAKPHPIKPQIMSNALTVLDEMVTNACYNAPFAKQKQVVSRTLRIDLKKEEYSNVFWGYSYEKLVVGVIDPFGALDMQALLQRLIKSHQQGMDSTMNKGLGGAGIGFRMIYDYASSLTVAVQPGKHTAVVACFPVNLSPKNAQLEKKNLHVYVGETPKAR